MNYEIIWTGDGSPSLKQTECMHHCAGAYGETQYIYGEAIRRALALPFLNEYSVLVVGLGLGYIELLAMGEYLKHLNQSELMAVSAANSSSKTNAILPFKMLSFECDDFLVQSFLAWLANSLETQHPLFEVYESIGKFVAEKYNLPAIKKALVQAHSTQAWICEPLLGKDTIPKQPFNIILYDAFSGRSTPDLWTEEFLVQALTQMQCKPSVFTTYACTGVLKRSLIACGYEVEKRAGYSGKRDSTYAQIFQDYTNHNPNPDSSLEVP